MDDHFWPAVYPALIVGVIVGLALAYNVWSGILGALGGLAGGFLAQFTVDKLGLQEDFLRLACLLAGAAAGAWLFSTLGRRIVPAKATGKDGGA